MVKSCAPCQHNQKLNLKEPLMPYAIPQKPWHTLGCDIFFWNNSPYLLLSDYYSKFPLVRKLSNIRSDTTIAHLKFIFEEHGIPNKLVTGNDTQFTSALFQEFCSTYGVIHVTTSPYYLLNTNCNTIQIWSWWSRYLSSIGNRYPAVYVASYVGRKSEVKKCRQKDLKMLRALLSICWIIKQLSCSILRNIVWF